MFWCKVTFMLNVLNTVTVPPHILHTTMPRETIVLTDPLLNTLPALFLQVQFFTFVMHRIFTTLYHVQ
jgi:hypothetical protein